MNPLPCINQTNARTARYASDDLTRGHEKQLLVEMMPAVAEADISLDLSQVLRIDAAGISALLALYTRSAGAGHRFKISNPSPRVAQMLALVGLSPLLLCRGESSKSGPCDCQRFAA